MTDRFHCPGCGGDLYRGSHQGCSAYKCMSANQCEFSRTAIGRTKDEVRRVNQLLDACQGGGNE